MKLKVIIYSIDIPNRWYSLVSANRTKKKASNEWQGGGNVSIEVTIWNENANKGEEFDVMRRIQW